MKAKKLIKKLQKLEKTNPEIILCDYRGIEYPICNIEYINNEAYNQIYINFEEPKTQKPNEI